MTLDLSNISMVSQIAEYCLYGGSALCLLAYKYLG